MANRTDRISSGIVSYAKKAADEKKKIRRNPFESGQRNWKGGIRRSSSSDFLSNQVQLNRRTAQLVE